jgi:hypothetical protein
VADVLLKALAAAYLQFSVPHIDSETLQILRSTNLSDTIGILISKTISGHVVPNGPQSQPSLWRNQVHAIVQDLVAPEAVDWMDDQDTCTYAQYTSRAFDEVSRYLSRYTLCLSCEHFLTGLLQTTSFEHPRSQDLNRKRIGEAILPPCSP